MDTAAEAQADMDVGPEGPAREPPPPSNEERAAEQAARPAPAIPTLYSVRKCLIDTI